MSYEKVNKLEVWRTLSDGSSIAVGELAQNNQGVYFQYHINYLANFSSLSPFNLTSTHQYNYHQKNLITVYMGHFQIPFLMVGADC